jgi:hypothetical protein
LPANGSDIKRPRNGKPPIGVKAMDALPHSPPTRPAHFARTGRRFRRFFACFDPSIPHRIALRNGTGCRPAA